MCNLLNFYYSRTSAKVVVKYVDEEGNELIPQTVTHYYKKLPFNIAVEKTIKELTIDGESKNIGSDSKLTKLEIPESKLATAGGSEHTMGGNDYKIQQINDLTAIALEKKRIRPSKMLEIIVKICKIEPLSAREISKYLNRDYRWLKKEYISKLVKNGKLYLLYPDNPKSPS